MTVQAQHIVFVSDNPEQALEAPAGYALSLPADPAYAQWQTQSFVDRARAQGRQLTAWCDCRTTLPSAAIRLRNTWRLDGWIGQAESGAELGTALAAGAPVVIGNPNAWTQRDRDTVTALINQPGDGSRLAVVAECYTNAGGPWPNQYSAAGVPVSSLCVGLYDASGEQVDGRYVSVDEYLAHRQRADGSDALAGMCAYVSGVHDGELEKLPVSAAPPPPPPPPNNGPSASVVRNEIANLARSWETHQTESTRRSRITVARRIVGAASTDQRWTRVAGDIAVLLDKAGIQ